MTTKAITIHREGIRVQLISNGRLVFDVPWEAALEIAKALNIQARRAEEQAKAEKIILDQAILLRLGSPLGLSSNPDIQAEAAKEAAWNSQLRRYLPGGIKSGEQVGTPTVIKEELHG